MASGDSPRAEEGAPRFVLFGEPQSTSNTLVVNVEPLAQRCQDRGWSISPHSHPNFAQVVLVLSGGGEMTSDDQRLSFAPPCVICVPRHHIHGFDYERNSDGWVLTIAEYFLSSLLKRLPELNTLFSGTRVIALDATTADAEKLNQALLGLDSELREKSIGYLQAVEVHLWTVLLTLLRRSGVATTSISSRTFPRLVENFQTLVEERFRDNVSLSDLASELAVSPAYLRAACVKTLGMPPLHVIHERLAREAKRELLFGDMTIEQLAHWLGFASTTYFTRFFKRHAGMSPGEFRQSHRKVSLPSE